MSAEEDEDAALVAELEGGPLAGFCVMIRGRVDRLEDARRPEEEAAARKRPVVAAEAFLADSNVKMLAVIADDRRQPWS